MTLLRLSEDSELLLWTPTIDAPAQTIRLHSPQPLLAFIGLADKPDPRALLKFAKQFGPLGICVHGRPYQHGEPPGLRVGLEADVAIKNQRMVSGSKPSLWAKWPRLCEPRCVQEAGVTYFAEPLGAWLQLARAAKALHETVARLRQQQRPRVADLRTLAATRFGIGKSSKHFRALTGAEGEPERDRDSSWFLVGERLNEWLVGAPVRFFCEIEEERGKFDVDFVVGDGLGIFPVVAAQLVATLSDPQRGKAVICSGCRLPFIQTREPSRGMRSYCVSCRRKRIPVRDAVHDFREHKRRAHELYAKGKDLAEIADQLGIEQKRVERYLMKERR